MQKPYVRREPPKATANPLCTGTYSSAINRFLFCPIPECSADAVSGSGWPRFCSADTYSLGLEALEQRRARVWLEQPAAKVEAFLTCLCSFSFE